MGRTVSDVPKIAINGTSASSTAQTAVHVADTCACWSKSDMRRAYKLLRGGGEILCLDATAHTALIAVALDMTMRGTIPSAAIIKSYEHNSPEAGG